jgi:hypothetical protein
MKFYTRLRDKIEENIKRIRDNKEYIKNYIFDFFNEDQVRFFVIILLTVIFILFVTRIGNKYLYIALLSTIIIILIIFRPDTSTINNYKS